MEGYNEANLIITKISEVVLFLRYFLQYSNYCLLARVTPYADRNQISINMPLIITYNGVEKELTQQNIALLKTINNAKTPDSTRKFTVILESSNEIANILPKVSSMLTPPKIDSNICISAFRHQLYNP